MKRIAFRGRTFVTILIALSFVVLVISSLVLYAVPRGMSVLSLNKHEWEQLHIVFGMIFIFVGFFHVAHNWKALMVHIKKNLAVAQTAGERHVEFVVALLLCVLLFVTTLQAAPPASYLLDLRRVAFDVLRGDEVTEGQQGFRRGAPD